MPRKLHFKKPELHNINITARAYEHLVARKRVPTEPIYELFDRIMTSYLESDAAEWQKLYYMQAEMAKEWMRKYQELQKLIDKGLHEQTRLD